MQIKLITSGAQEFSEPVAELIKVSSRGLIGHDKQAFEKRAGAEFAHELTKIASELPSDEPLVHLLAIGATEDYGANRNGDGFKRACCERYHDTFVKFAHFYRDHKNKDPKKSYGRVKLSAWHDPMKRIELVVALNGSDDAARRHGALLADKEMQKLAAGKEIPVSMACRVPFDVCSWCGNKAPTRAQYCDSIENGGMCKAGGLKDNIGALVDIDGGIHQLHADNPDPTFFDISHVFRPADRIAYVSGMLKAASATGVVSGSELAEALGVTMPHTLMIDPTQPADVRRMIKLAYALSDKESGAASLPSLPESRYAGAFTQSVQPVPQGTPELYREKLGHTLRALADERVSLPLSRFLELFTDCSAEKAASVADVVGTQLPGIYSRLLSRGDFVDRVRSNPYTPAASTNDTYRAWALKQASTLSLRSSHVEERATRAAIRQEDVTFRGDENIKLASDNSPASRLAEEYALYKLAFLGAIPEDDPETQLTAALVLLQNYVS